MNKCIVVHEDEVAPFSKGGRDFRVLLSPSLQGASIALGTATVHPGQSTPHHSHDNSEVAWYVISGSGTITVGGREIPASRGTVVQAPAGELHWLTNTSKAQNLKCLVVFSPAGPEEAFIV